MRAPLQSMTRLRLRLLLGLLFCGLALPAAVLVGQASAQLKWESFQQHRVLAEEMAGRIDARLRQWVDAEEARSFADYGFLVVAGAPAANFVQRSALSEYPPKSAMPGLVGYFQVDAQVVFSTPLLPRQTDNLPAYGIIGAELAGRQAAQARVLEILSRNQLVKQHDLPPAPAPARPNPAGRGPALAAKATAPAEADEEGGAAAPAVAETKLESQAAFDQLSGAAKGDASRQKAPTVIQDKKRDAGLKDSLAAQAEEALGKIARLDSRVMRKEQSALPEPPALAEAAKTSPLRVATFESEIDPFEFKRLDSGHFVLFRKVWRDGQRLIQGLVIESGPFVRELIEAEFQQTLLARMSQLAVAYDGGTLAVLAGAQGYEYRPNTGSELRGDLLFRTRLSAPLADLELIFTIDRLPPGPGAWVLAWLAGIMAVVLCGGFWLLYRLGVKLLDLAQQQQDFISAVSHELKTPLTSIRMYGEMLCAGWVPEDKKPVYYQFIHAESERLTRLINNVLQLARLTRNRLDIRPSPHTVGELLDGIRPKIASQVERCGFVLHIDCPDDIASLQVLADADCFAQIIINLVDNALKFSAKALVKTVDIRCLSRRDQTIVFAVRDYGPGIPKSQMKKIFGLFYRLENELTRETVGTGIGLSLVRQLALAMRAEVELVNREPGAEFRVVFPALKAMECGDSS